MKRLVACAVVAMFGACTGGGSDDGDGGLADAGGGAGGAGGGGGELGPCEAPAGARVLMDFQDYRLDPTDVLQDSVARGLVADGTDVYIAFLNSAVRLRQAGSAPTVVYTAQPDSLGLSIWPRDGGGALIRDGALTVDGTGAPVAYPSAEHPADGLDGPAAEVVAPDGNRYVQFLALDDQFQAVGSHFVRLTPGAASQAVVALNVDGAARRQVVFGAGALYSNGNLVNSEAPDPDLPVRVDPGAGGVHTIPVDKPGPVFLVTDHFIYYNRDKNAPLEELGVWRVPVAGGTGEKLGGTFGGFTGATDGQGMVVLTNAKTLFAIADTAGASLAKIADLPVRSVIDAACTAQGLAVAGGEVVSTIFDQARNQTLVFKYTLP